MKSKHLLLLMLLALFAPWAAMAQETLTVYGDGTVTNRFVPIDGYNVDGTSIKSEYIMPASVLTAMNGKDITKMTIYLSTVGEHSWGNATFRVFMKEVENTTISSFTGYSDANVVYLGGLDCTQPTMDVNFTENYSYNGGNLLIGFYIVTSGSYTGSWSGYNPLYAGETVTGASIGGTSATQQNFLPKTTFTYQNQAACPKPSGLIVNGLTATWNAGTASQWNLQYKKVSESTWTPVNGLTAATYTFTGLDGQTDYEVQVQADCGSETSEWTNSFNFTTPCNAITTFPWTEDFEDFTANTVPDCWDNSATTGTDYNSYPERYWGVYSYGGNKMIRVYNYYAHGPSAIINSQPITLPSTGEYELTFDYSNLANCGAFKVNISDDGGATYAEKGSYDPAGTTNYTDPGTFTPANPISLASYSGKTIIIQFYATPNYGSGAIFVDNLKIDVPPTCQKPTDLECTGTTATTATLSWTNGASTQTAWQICLNGDEEHLIMADSNPFTIATGLTPTTTYSAKVRAYCDETDQSEWSNTINFTTTCPESYPLDYTCGFEGPNTTGSNPMPLCWTRMGSHTTIPNVSTSYHHGEGSRSLYFYKSSSSTYTNEIAALPAIDANMNTVRVVFYGRLSSSSTDGTINVGYVTDLADATTFQSVQTVTLTTSWEKHTISFGNVGNVSGNIAFQALYSTASAFIYIDDVLVEAIPSCVEPSGLDVVANSITTNSVQLTWTAGGTETAWDIYCTTSAEAPTAATTPTVTGTTDNPCTVSGLTASTHYYAYVRSRCSDSEQSPWSAVKEFDTECDVVSTFPWTENFEGMTANTVPLCWDNSATTGTDYGSHPEYYWGVYSYDGNKMIRMYNFYAHGPFAIINTPTIVLPAEAKELTFDYTHNATSGAFSVKISEDGGTTFTELQSYTKGTGSSYEDPGTFTEATISLADYANKSVILQFYSAANYGSGAIFVDNIKIDVPPTCIKPSALKCDSKTAHTATLSWTNGEEGQNNWVIAYSTNPDFDPDDPEVTLQGTLTNPVTIEGLSQSTTYYAYVRADCGVEEGLSAWCNTKVTFTTLAGNGTPTGLAVAPASITSSQATASWNAVAGNILHESYDIYWDLATTTSVPAEPAAPNLISGITATSQDITGLNPETSYKVWVRDNCGTDGYSSWSSAVTFSTVSACQTPDGLAESNVTSTSATITWNTYGLTDFNLRYSTDGTTWTTVPNVNSPYTFDNTLSANKAYQVQVQATCADAETWSTVLNFRTECAPMTITETDYINEGFEYYTGTTYSTNGVVPYCWDNDADGNILPHVIGSGSYYYVHNGSKALTFYGSGNCYAYLPEFTNNLNTLQISFWARVESTSYGTLTLGYFDSENEFKVIDTYTSKSTMTEYTTYLGLKENVPDNARLVFRWYCSNQYSCCIDDVVVKLAPSCYPVENLTYSDVLATTVKLSWDLVDDTQDGWEVQYAEDADFTQFVNTVNAYSNDHYEITALNPETHYWMRVRGNCYPEGGYGEWSNVVDFTTLEACPAPSNLAASNLTQNTADLTWTGESDSYNIRYRTAATMADPIFSEDFSNGIGNWTMVNCHSNTGVNNGVFRFYYNDNPPQYLISPEITGITTDAILEFVYYNNSTTYEETFKVGLSSTDNATASFSWSETLAVKDQVQHTYHATVPAGTKYMAIQLLSDDKLYLYIDNIVIANAIPAGEWQPATRTTTSTQLTGLTAGTEYEVQVQGVCNNEPGNWCEAITFTTMAEGNKVFTNANNDGKWGTAGNWVPAGAPALTDEVIIRANATIDGDAAAKKITFEGTPTPTLTIADGGKLMTDNSVTATVKKNVASYGESTNGGYVLLTSPIGQDGFTSYDPATAGLITANEGDDYTYDLYEWLANPSDDNEWKNYRKNSFNLYHGEGYLYANKNDVELTFTGTVQANNVDVEKTGLDYGTEHFQAWNLYGNPFMCDAYLNDATSADMAFYRMNTNGDGFTAATGTIRPMEGVFVQTSAASQGFKFSRTQTETSRALLNVNLTKVTLRGVEGSSDNAIIRFDQGGTLEKFSFREDASKVYIPQDNIDYAVVSAEAMGELPVNFRANENGSYTLSFSSEEVSFSYLHLVDNMTGNDVDLLQTPSYTFDALTTDYESRFKLVFATGNAADDSFAFYSNGNWIINNDGQATLQVIDVTGRILSSETVNGSVSTTINAAPGVYMLRLVNGDNVKVQKVVVR